MTMQPAKQGTIFDSAGNPVAKASESVADLNLPPGTQALIEERINAGLDQLREHNRDELARLSREKAKFWKVLAAITTVVSFAWGLFTWFVGPQTVKHQADQYVRQHLTEPAMKTALSEAAQVVAVKYVDEKLVPLERRADVLKSDIASLKNDITQRQEALTKAEDSIRSKVDVQKLSVDAKMGSLPALTDLNAAETEVGALQSAQPNYIYVPVARAALQVAQKKENDAADTLNQFLKEHPSSVGFARQWEIFKPLATNPRLTWPSSQPAKQT